jgi:RNA polymerase sigma-70 factor (ECF subfamily)
LRILKTERHILQRTTLEPMTDQILPWDRTEWPSLLAAARAGDGGALGEVFERLDSYCRLVAGRELSAELLPKVGASDIAQKSLLEAFARFSSFQGQTEAEVRAWLSTIVNHNAIDAARHFRDAERRSTSRELSLHDSRIGGVAGRGPTPSLALHRQEDDFALRQAIARLTQPQRAVLEMRYRDGLDYRQIAAALDSSEVAVRKLYSRAIEALRNLLAADGSRFSPTR